MSCDCNTLVVGEAGPQGAQGLAGTNGTNGTNGVNAFTTTTASFTQPSDTVTSVSVTVAENRWIAANQPIYISGAGFYRVTTVGGSPYTNIVCTLVKTDGISGGATVSANRKVSASSVAVYTDPINQLTVNGNSLLDGTVTINNSGADKDFRVAGDTDTHLLFTDASTNRVGISTNVPEVTLHVEGDVKIGTSAVPSDLTVTKATTLNSSNSATGDVIVKDSSGNTLLFCDASASKIGVKNTSPSVEFDVTGDVEITGSLKADLGNNTLVVDTTNHRVGIGTAAPSVTLDVTGQAKISSHLYVDTDTLVVNGSSDFVGIKTAVPTANLDVTGTAKVSGDFTVDTNTLVVNASSNYVGIKTASPTVELDVTGAAKISGNLTVDTNTLYVNATSNRVGIGTTSPAQTLDVSGNIRSSAQLIGVDLAVNTSLLVVDSSGSAVRVNNNSQTETFSVNGSARFYNGDVIFKTGSTETLYYDASLHRIGLGTTSPTEKLDVVGNAKVSGNLAIDTNVLYVDAANNRVGVNDSSPSVALDVAGDANITGNLTVNTDVLYVDTTNNWVGINESSPSHALDVAGSVQATDYRVDSSVGSAKITKLYHHTGSSRSITLNAGASTSESYTVTGVDFGDFVQVAYASSPSTASFMTNVMLTAVVTGTDTVKVLFTNISAATNYSGESVSLLLFVTRAVAV